MSPSKMVKTQAYSDGRYYADGGPDLRSKYKGEMLEAYDYGVKTRRDEIAAAEAEKDHPLTQLASEASDIAGRAGNPDVRELAWLFERLCNYLKEHN